MHLKRRRELTGVCLPALEHMFQKGLSEMNYINYQKECKKNEKQITNSPNVKLMSSVKARKIYRQDNLKKAGLVDIKLIQRHI